MKEFNENNPFKTPEEYFESFDDRLMDKLSEESSNIPKEEGFDLPEGYFDGLHKNIQGKLDNQETKVVQLHPYKKYYYAVASIAAIVLVIFGLNWNTSEELRFEDLAEADIENYFENNEFDLSAYEIAEVIPLDELEINDILVNRFEEENMLDYLNENIEDFETFNLEDNEKP